MLDDDARLEPVPGLDWTSLTLTQSQGFLLSRVMGPVTVKDLVAASGLKDGDARKDILELVRAGALEMDRRSMSAAQSKASAGTYSGEGMPIGRDPEYGDFVFSPAGMQEETDLSDRQRKRILFVFAHLETWNHYALLGLKRTAKANEIKKGYFRASKEFHPDAYFRKELGTFRPKVDKIFQAMKGAYDALSNQQRRAEYDATLGMDFSPEELKELEARAEARRQTEVAAQQEAERKRREESRAERVEARKRERRLKNNPMIGAIKRGQEFADMALKAFEKKDMKSASRHAKMALEFARGHASVVDRVEPVLKEANRVQAQILVRKLKSALDPRKDDIANLSATLTEMAPNDPGILLEGASVVADHKDFRQAIQLAQRACSAKKDSVKAWEALLNYAEQMGQLNTALRAAETILELDASRKDIKDRAKKIRRDLK